MSQTAKCADCGRKVDRGVHSNQFPLKNGRCVNCQDEPDSLCSEGHKCDFSRVMRWDLSKQAAIKDLPMCETHDKERKRRLRAARARQRAADKAYREQLVGTPGRAIGRSDL